MIPSFICLQIRSSDLFLNGHRDSLLYSLSRLFLRFMANISSVFNTILLYTKNYTNCDLSCVWKVLSAKVEICSGCHRLITDVYSLLCWSEHSSMEVRVKEIHFGPIKIMYFCRGKISNNNFIFVLSLLLREYKIIATHERYILVLLA